MRTGIAKYHVVLAPAAKPGFIAIATYCTMSSTEGHRASFSPFTGMVVDLEERGNNNIFKLIIIHI